MFRTVLLLLPAALLAGCISFSSSEQTTAPHHAAFCQEKESQCREICADVAVQAFSCKSAPEGLEYQCQCKKPGQRL